MKKLLIVALVIACLGFAGAGFSLSGEEEKAKETQEQKKQGMKEVKEQKKEVMDELKKRRKKQKKKA
jgi:hypothetical protein